MARPTRTSPPPLSLGPAVQDVLVHHAGPAISLCQLAELVRMELGPPPDRDALLATLVSEPISATILDPGLTRASECGLRTWVLPPRRVLGPGTRGRLTRLLTRSLETLGRGVDPASVRELARWERLLIEEEAVRQTALRWGKDRPRERPPTTSHPRDRRRRARARARGQRPGHPRPRAGGSR